MTAICLQPVIPIKMDQLMDMLGIQQSRRSWQHAGFGADEGYGESMVDLGRGQEGTLFPPLSTDK